MCIKSYKKVLLRSVIIVTVITLSVFCIKYLLSLRTIEIDIADIDSAFSSKIVLTENTPNGRNAYNFESGLFEGNYEIIIADYTPSQIDNAHNVYELSDKTKVQLLTSAWQYSTRGGMIFPAKYYCCFQYNNGKKTVLVTAYCNFPKFDGYENFFKDIAVSINEFSIR